VGVPTDMFMKEDTEKILTGICKVNISYHETLVLFAYIFRLLSKLLPKGQSVELLPRYRLSEKQEIVKF